MMIKLLAKNYSQAVSFLCDKFDLEVVKYDLIVTRSKDTVAQILRDAMSGAVSAMIVVGDVSDSCADFCDAFGLTMFYDKFAEQNVVKYCKYAQVNVPPQYVLDKLCLAPETFNHVAPIYGCQCACYGEYNKKQVYFIPDDVRECQVLLDNYISKNLFKEQSSSLRYVFKVFGMSNRDVISKLGFLNKNVSRKCETTNLDSRIVITFPSKSSKGFVNDVLNTIREKFGDSIYSVTDQSLAKTVVEALRSINKTISTAESMTGGMIASSIVDVAGASAVLYEGAVTYSIPSKCKRLGLNPHFIDEHGVISKQVAQAMAEGLRKNGCDVAVSVTGNAGPTSEDGQPVGLCYIGVATERNVAVYRNVFAGDRNSIRAQAANMALFLTLKTLTK